MGVKREPILRLEDTPFETSGQACVYETKSVKVYNDKWPVCEGHMLFVPKKNTPEFVAFACAEAIKYGNELRDKGEIDAYHFGMNIGEEAGQTVMWPHVHFIPRHENDCEGFPGSVRLAHRNGRGAKYYMEHPDFKDEYIKIHKDHAEEEGFSE